MTLRSRGTRSTVVLWLLSAVVATLTTSGLAHAGLLMHGVLAIVVLVTGIAMLSSLRVALVLSAATIPLEAFVVFGGAGTLAKVVMVGLAASYLFHLLRGRIRPRWDALSWSGWLWLMLAGTSLAWSQVPQVGQVSSLVQLIVLAFIVAAVTAERPSYVASVLRAYTLSACAIAFVGVYRYLTVVGDTGPLRVSAGEGQGVEHFAAYLLPAFVALLVASLRPTHGFLARILLATLTLSTVMGMLVSGTRSAWLAALVAASFVIVSQMRFRQLPLVVGLVAVGIAAVSLTPGVAELVTNRTATAVESGGEGRLDIWNVGIGLVESSPLLGRGYSDYPSNFDVTAIASAPFPTDELFIGTGRGPHSIYLSNIVDLGVVGIFLFLTWMATLFRPGGAASSQGLMVRAAVLAFLVQGAYLDILNRKYFWLFVGLAEGLRRIHGHLIEVRSRDAEPARPLVD